MQFNISNHAREQMNRRGIEEKVVLEVLNSRAQTIITEDKTIYQSIIVESGRQFLIRIFVNHLKIPNLVITVYKTSKIRKYYESNL